MTAGPAPDTVRPRSPFPLFTLTRRVTMGDTDGGGVVHFAAPYRWAEAAYAEWRAGIGHSIASSLETGFAAPVVASSAEYLSQLIADDVVDVTLWSDDAGVHSFALRTEISPKAERPAIRIVLRYVWTEFRSNGLRAAPVRGRPRRPVARR